MNSEQLQEIINRQSIFFKTGTTLNIQFRIDSLKKLYKAIISNQNNLLNSLYIDLNKNNTEAFECEEGLCLSEISYALHHIRKWSKPQKKGKTFTLFPSSNWIYPQPFGKVLIISPWNYPVLLTLIPLINAIAAGNTAIIKASSKCPSVHKILDKIISETFSKDYICFLPIEIRTDINILDYKYDFIFFTGNSTTGRTVMEKASRNLTPVCLELGGKNPCIIEEDANIKIAAKRIIWGKLLNAGQTCVAPDYLLINSKVKNALIIELKKEIQKQYGNNILENSEYAKIINLQQFKRIIELYPKAKNNPKICKIEPTLIDIGNLSNTEEIQKNPLMQNEIFGPLLPYITYDKIENAADFIKNNATPLSLYLFSKNKKVQDFIINSIPFGGGCINDTVIHISTNTLPFGGLGQSGINSYHGKWGFDCFTHYKSILKQSSCIDIPLRYTPTGNKLKILKLFFK